MKTWITLLLLFTVVRSYGQYMFPEKQKGCDLSMFFLESDTILTKYKTIDSLAYDIFDGFNPKYKNKLKGTLIIQVYIDSVGTPCCVSIMNHCNVKSSKLFVQKAVNSLDKWTIPIKDGKPSNVCAIIKMTFSDTDITLERLGYNYYTKYKTLDKVVLRR